MAVPAYLFLPLNAHLARLEVDLSPEHIMSVRPLLGVLKAQLKASIIKPEQACIRPLLTSPHITHDLPCPAVAQLLQAHSRLES